MWGVPIGHLSFLYGRMYVIERVLINLLFFQILESFPSEGEELVTFTTDPFTILEPQLQGISELNVVWN